MADSEQGELGLLTPDTETLSVAAAPTQAPVECKGIRSTQDFPADPTSLSREQIEHHYQAMRNSHASLTRSRGQLQRRSRELSSARDQFLHTLRGYEGRLMALGQEKAEALRIAQDMHKELEAFEDRQQALDGLLKELDAAKEEAGYWSIFSITRLIERMRRLLSGGGES
jgi:chromosome segregation ATPase